MESFEILLKTKDSGNNGLHSRTIQTSLQDLVSCDTYWDTMLVCKDGNLLHNKLTVGFLFPFLSELPIFNLPLQSTILLPEHSVREVTSAVFSLLDINQLESKETIPKFTEEDANANNSDICEFGKDIRSFKCGVCTANFLHFDRLLNHKKIHTANIVSTKISDIDSVFHKNHEIEDNEMQQMIIEETPIEIKYTENMKNTSQAIKLDFHEFGEDFLSNDHDMFYINNKEQEINNTIPQDKTIDIDEAVTEKLVKVKTSKKNSKQSSISSKGTRSAKKSYTGEIFPGEYPYKCSYCDKRFKQVGHVNLHERTHTGGQKYICPYCNKKFNQLSHLKDHERIHTGEKPFMCSDCGKCFGYNSALKSHKKIHTGEKTYKCTFCEKTFNQLGNLRTHERLHTGELKYMCSECGKCYNTRSNLTRHACNRLAAENSVDSQVGLEDSPMIQQLQVQDQKFMM